MTLVERRIFRINDFVDNINPAQICVEPMEDPDLDFRMYCGTDILGNITKWLAKDQKARITDLSITDRLNMNTKDVVNVGSLYAPWTDLDNDIWARLRFYYNGAYPTSEFVQARPGLECGVRLDSTQSKAHFFCDTNRGLFFNGPEMTLKDYDSDTSKYNFLLTSNSSGSVLESEIGLSLGSAGSLSLFDANILSCEDWDTDKVLLSASEEEVQDCYDLFGQASIFSMIYRASALGPEPPAVTLQDAYENGGSVITSDGPTYWVWPYDGGVGSPFSIANNAVDNTSAVLQIANESTESEKYGIMFSGAAGDLSSAGALGHRLWTAGSISIGRTASTGFKSYFVANQGPFTNPDNRYTNAMIYSESTGAGDPATKGISYVRARAGGVDEGFANAELQLYVKSGNILLDNYAGGNVTVSANVSLSGGTVRISDGYRSGSDYTGASVPWASSTANWSAFAALAGPTGSIIDGIVAAASAGLTPEFLTLKIKNGTTENTDLYSFNGSAAKTLNFAEGTNITLTPTAGTLTIAATDTTYTSSLGISLVGTDFRHSNSVTAKTQALYPIAYDAQGHITASGSAVTSLKNPNNLILKVKSGTVEGFDLYTYDGSVGKTLDIRQGSNITLTEGAGILTIAATDTTYTSSLGISLVGTDFRHSNSVTAQSTQALYPIKIDAQGHISGYGTAVTSLKNPKNLVLKVKSGTVEGFDLYTYDGSVGKTLDIRQGSNITLTEAAGSVTIAATDTTYPLTQGYVAYGNGTGITGKSTFIFDPSGGDTLSIGGLSASTRLSLAGTTAAGGSFSSRVYSTTADTAAGLAFNRSRHATLGTHGAVTTSDVLSNILSYGSDGSTFVLGSQISTIASGVGAWSTAGNQSARLAFSTINAGSFAEKMTLSSAGYLGIGTSAPEHGFHLKGTEVSNSTIRTDCYSTTGSEVASLRMYKSNHATSYGALANGDLIGRIRFIGSRPTNWTDGCIIEALSRGSWASAAGETTDLRVQLRHAGSTATRFLLTSIGGLGLGQHVTNDWTMGHFLASQRLDGSTAGSSQSIVAMTLGLRTTSTTANQVLKLTSSDSDSPLVLQAGYFYSLLVNVSATFESGDKKGYRNETYALTVFYDEVRDSALINSNTTTEHSNVSPGSFSFSVSSGVLQFLFTPSAFCSVDNPINVLATICGGTKIKTGQSQIC